MNCKELWSFQYNAPILGIEIGDINGNGQKEILAHTKTGNVLILSLEGKLLSEKEISKNSAIWCSRIADLNNDGQNLILLGGLDGILRVIKSTSSFSLKPIWAHQFGASIGGIILNDITNDGNQEIIAHSLDKSIRALNHNDGSLIWGQVFEDGVGDAIVWHNDEDGANKEVIACGNDGTLRIFNGKNGELIWHKRFSDKMRCIARLNSAKRSIITCGGDDKLLHLIDKYTREEVKFLEFEDYMWKSLSFPTEKYDKIIASTYSFAYFDEFIEMDKIEFSSKIFCFNSDLEVLWEIEGKNAEYLNSFKKEGKLFVLVGTTKGEILIIDSNTGKISFKIKKNSCINMVQVLPNEKFAVSCDDDGQISGFGIED